MRRAKGIADIRVLERMIRILDKKLQIAVVLVIASLGIGLSFVASTAVQARDSHGLSEEFEQVARDTTLAIQSDIDVAIEILHSIRALYADAVRIFEGFTESAIRQLVSRQEQAWAWP